MKYTYGYNTTVSIPIVFTYKCPYCRKTNTKTTNLANENFSFTRDGSKAAAINTLQERLDNIVKSSDANALKSSGIYCSCSYCAKTPPWAGYNMGSTSSGAFIAIILLFIAFAIFFVKENPSLLAPFSSASLQDNIPYFVIPAVVLIILIAILSTIIKAKKKNTVLPKDSFPTIIAIGDEAKAYAPENSFKRSIYNS